MLFARVPHVGNPMTKTALLAKFHRASGPWCQKAAVKSQDIPSMPPCDFKPQQCQGMSKQRMMELRRLNCNPMTMKVTYYKSPVFVHQGHMQWLWDMDGKRYLDFFAGVATVSLGHCHPKVTAAATAQMNKLWHTTNIYVFSALQEYCEKLASHLPDPLKVVYLTNSGSEANDLAMLMSRLHTGNHDILSFRGSYHGGSPQTMALTANSAYKYPVANGGSTTVRASGEAATAETPPYRPPGQCVANDQYIGQLKETFATSLPSRIAAFFAEPIQGMGGAVQYPKDYLKQAYKMVRERGGICIADEVQTGFGRTGSHFWGFQGHEVMPDIVTMAKGIATGFPMGAVVTTPEIAASFAKGVHFNTFGGNPMACTIGSAVLDAIKEDGLQENSHLVGTYMLTQLAKLRDKHQIVGDVRGKGLQIGVEMVEDKVSRTPLSLAAMSDIFEDTKDMGVLIGKGGVYGQNFRVQPPMCVTKEDADYFVAVFDRSIQNYMDRR
ncbi:hypothetical protein NHX12_028083 [Muraenolepis orangiensis]|uniref:Alanine--glyoxylate aminotransferase 2, mitochondrial n=1 Tax=Muraenolepis orangiensis TaxID=630683 RepID=A0A9Q0IPV4_9TELE|nr:hypothetical protein NHX12_028083 [Muraenolepis orangiensis]